MKKFRKILSLLLAMLILTMAIAGCGSTAASESDNSSFDQQQIETTDTSAGSAEDLLSETEQTDADSSVTENTENTEFSASDDTAASDDLYLDPDGSYDSKEDVALYLYLYHELPSNYITKKEAQNLGWSGGSLEAYAEGKCIGGSYFGNYEGVLPEGDYHECDIDTLGASSRGAKRIVYSDDWDIYYTEDHYETFTLLYTADGPATEEIIYPQ